MSERRALPLTQRGFGLVLRASSDATTCPGAAFAGPRRARCDDDDRRVRADRRRGAVRAAALCVQWKTPILHHDVGDIAVVRFRTYTPYGPSDRMTLRPFAAPTYPFRVTATGPNGETTPVNVRPSTDGLEWSGEIVVSSEGVWQVELLNLPGDSPCGPILRIGVGIAAAVAPPASLPVDQSAQPPPAGPHHAVLRASNPLAWLLAAAVLAGIVLSALRLIRRRRDRWCHHPRQP